MANKGTISAYLYFDGNCEEAVNYYAQVFELDPPEMMKYEKGKYPMEVTDAEEGLVMYASLKFENMNMMFSDDPNSHPEPSETPVIQLNWATSDPELFDRVWEKMSKDGSIHMAAAKTFFAEKFGVVSDKFGIYWQLDLMAVNQ